MLQNEPSRHLRMPSLWPWQWQIASFHYNCGTNWYRRCKTHWTYYEPPGSIPTFWRMRPSMARTFGTATPLRHPVVKSSFMKHQWCKGHGHCKVQMHGIGVPPKTITNATYITSPKHAHIVLWGWQSSFQNIVKSQTWATWHTWKHLLKSLKWPQVLRLKHIRGTHSFTIKNSHWRHTEW